MISYISHVMTLANSIIGVSVLAMPFCFKQCGILLAAKLLILCSLLSRLACHFLIKSAVMSRRRNFEFLAFHAFGPVGKLFVELFIIGFLLGTSIAFFVVIGDLGPQIIGKIFDQDPQHIRCSFLLTTAVLIVLPLGLLKNIDSLSSICTVTIGFYLCLVLKVIAESTDRIFQGDWYDNVNFWRPAGILQCLPIFSMALFCQTQLFEIYESIPNVSLEKMNIIVKGALNICTLVYIFVGFFGYVGFCKQTFSGNILMNFVPSMTSDIIKIGFVLSVIFSFPLVIFPCRASLNSLLFRRAYLHDSTSNYIPEIRFRCLTVIIVTVSLTIGLLMPNIEFVLGLVGSTIGVMICLICPAGFFIAISTKNTNERLMAQAILFIGVWIMILGSYGNLHAIDELSTTKPIVITENPLINSNNIQINQQLKIRNNIHPSIREIDKSFTSSIKSSHLASSRVFSRELDIFDDKLIVTEESPAKFPPIQSDLIDNIHGESKENSVKDIVLNAKQKIQIIEEQEKIKEQRENDNLINSDAIKKEESEIALAAADEDNRMANNDLTNQLKEEQRIKDTLEQHKIETIELLKEQKAILEDMKKQKKEFEIEKQRLKNVEFNHIDDNALSNVDLHNNKKINIPIPINEKSHQQKNETQQTQLVPPHNEIQETVEKTVNKISTNIKFLKNDRDKNFNMFTENISSVQSRGPILNALTNWTIPHNFLKSLPKSENFNEEKNMNYNKKSQYNIPIALKLRNHTKDNNIHESDKNKFSERAFNQDTLQDQLREKRDLNEELSTPNTIIDYLTTNKNPLFKNSKINATYKKCMKNQSSLVNQTLTSKQIIQNDQPEASEMIITANSHVEYQQFINTSTSKLESEMTVNFHLKKRDLKALKFYGIIS